MSWVKQKATIRTQNWNLNDAIRPQHDFISDWFSSARFLHATCDLRVKKCRVIDSMMWGSIVLKCKWSCYLSCSRTYVFECKYSFYAHTKLVWSSSLIYMCLIYLLYLQQTMKRSEKKLGKGGTRVVLFPHNSLPFNEVVLADWVKPDDCVFCKSLSGTTRLFVGFLRPLWDWVFNFVH